MSGASNNHLKTEKPSKSKFSAVKINNVYRGTSTHSAPYNPINKHGLFQSVGKIVPSRRIPPPTNLPSLKSENCGNDPYVNLVPTGGQGWGTKDHCISDTPVPAAHVSLKNSVAATAAAAGGGSQNAAAPVAAAASSKPVVSTPSAAGYSAQSAGAGAATSSSAASATPRSVSGEKSWSSIMTSDATTAPPPPPSAASGAVATGSSVLSSLKSAHFHQEFPQLKTDATGSQRPAPATTASVAKTAVTSSVSAASSSGLLSSNMKRTVAGVPSLRPNTSGSWSHGGGGLFDQPAAATAGPVFGTAAAGGSSADHRAPPVLQGPAGPSVLAAGGTATAALLNKSGTAAAAGSQTAPFQSIVPYFMMSSAGAAATTCSITSTSAKSLARSAQTGGGHSASNSNRSATGLRAQQRPVMTGSSTPIVKSEDLQQLDHITDKYNSAWVGPDTDVDYNKKLSFSDGEDECVESGGNRKGSSSALRRADAVRNNTQSSRPPTDRPFGRAASGGEHLVATGRQSTRPLLSPSAQHKGVMSSAHMRSVPAGQSTYMSMTSGTSLARHRPAQHEEDTWRKRQQQQDEVNAAMQRSRQLRSRVDDAATDRYYQQQQQAQLAGKTGSVHSAVRSQRAHTSASVSATGLWTDRDRAATSLHDRNARRYTGAARDNGGGGAGGGYMMSRYSTAEDAGARRNNRSDDGLFESSVAQRNATGATHNDTRSDSNGGGGGGTNGYYDVEYYDYGTSWADQLENEARPPAKRDVKQRESEATVSAGDSGERRSRGRSTSSSMGDDSVGGGKQGGATGDASSSANDTLLSGTPTLLTRASASAVTDGLQREVCEGMVSLKPSQPASNRAARSSSTSTDVKSEAEAAAGRNYSSGKSAAEKSGASSQNQSSDATALPAAAATETAPPKNVWLARKETSRAQQETTCGDKTRANYPVVGELQRGDSTDTAQSQRHAAGDGGSSDNQPDMTAAYERRHEKRPAIRGQWSQRHDEAVDRRARGYHSDYQAARRDKRQHYQQPWEEEYERYDNRTRSEYYGSSGRAADEAGVRHTSSTTGSSGWQQSAPRWRTQTHQQQHRETMGADPQAPHEPQEAESSAGGSGGGGGWGVERRVVNDARRSSAGDYDAGTTTVTARHDRRVGYETSEDHVSNRRDQRKDQRDDRRVAGTRDKTGSGRVDSRRGEHVDARNDRHAAEPSHADTRLGGAGERRAHDGRTGGRGGRGRDKEQRTAAPTDTADNNSSGAGRKRETERPQDQSQQHQGDKLWDNTDRSYRQQPGDRRNDQRSTRRGKGDTSDRQQQQHGGGESRDNRRRGGAWRDEADDHPHVATRRSDQQNSRRGDTRRDRSGAAAATRNERSKRHAVPPASSSGAGSHDVPDEHHSRNADAEAGRPRWQLHADPDYRGSSASYRGSRREFRSQRALTGTSGGGAETRPRDTRSGMAGGGRRGAGTRHEPLETHSFSGGGGGRRHATPADDTHAAKSSIPPLVPNTPSCSAHRDSTLDSGSRKEAATCDVTTAPQQQQQTSLLDEHRHHCQARSPSDHTIEDGDWETASEGSHGAAACSVSTASRRHRRPSADTQPQLVDALTDKVPGKHSGASSTTASTDKPSVSTANTGARTRPGGKGAADCFKELDLNSGGVVVVDEHPQVTDDTDTVDDAEFREVMRRRTPRERQKGGAEEQGHKKREERGGRRGPSDKNSTAAGSSRGATNTRHERKSNNSQNTGSALTSNNNNNNAKSQHQRVSNRDRQQQQQSAVIASSGGAGVGSATCPVDGAVTSAAGGTAELRVENELLPRAPVVNAWDKPITAALRSVVAPAVSSAASSSVAASSSYQQLQQRPLSCADPAAPILYRPSMTTAALSYDAAGVPSKTIIFENTNFRGASAAVAGCGGKLSGGVSLAADRAAALAVCSASCASSLDNNSTPVASAAVLDKQRATAAPSSAAIQLPHMFSSEHVRHMKLDFTFDSSELTGAMTSSASTEETGAGMTSAAVTAAMISSGSADLNMKIASVKRVWDTPSVSPLPDAAAAVSSSCLHERQLSPSSVVAKETATVAVAAGGSVVGWSDAAGDSLQSFNVVAGGAGACKSPVDVASSMSSNNVCKVKPQQQQQQQQQQGSLTAPLQPPAPLTATRIHHLHQQPPQQSHMTAAEHPACCTCRQCLHGGMVEPTAAVVSMAVPLPDTIYQPGITSSITSPVSQVHLSAITSPASSSFLLGSAPCAPTVSQAIAAAYQPFQLDQHPPPVAPPPPPATVHRQYSQFPYAGSFGLMQTPPPTLGSVPAVSAADLSAALRHYPPSASSSPGSVAVAAAASMLGLKPCGPPPPIPSQPTGAKTAGGGASYQQQKLQFIQYDPALMGSHVRVNSQLLQQRQPPPVTPPSSVFNGGQGAAAAAFFQQGGSVQQTGGQLASYGIQQPGGYAAGIGLGMQQLRLTAAAALPWNSEVAAPPAIMSASRPPPPTAAATLRAAASSAGGVFRPPPLTAVAAGGVVVGGTSGPAPPLPPPQQQRYQTPIQRPTPSPHLSSAEQAKLRQAALQSAQNFFSRNSPSEHAANINNNANNLKAPPSTSAMRASLCHAGSVGNVSSSENSDNAVTCSAVVQQQCAGGEEPVSSTTAASSCTADHAAVNAPPAPSTCASSPTAVVTTCDVVVSDDVTSSTTNTSPSSAVTGNHAPAGSGIHAAASGQTWTSESAGSGNNADNNSTSANNSDTAVNDPPNRH